MKIETTDAALKDWRGFSTRYRSFLTLMADLEKIDSLQKAADEAEAARIKSLEAKDNINKTASTILEEAQQQANSILVKSVDDAQYVQNKTNKDRIVILEEATQKKNEAIAEGEKKAAELVGAAQVEAVRLDKFVKDYSTRAKVLETKIKVLDTTIATKQASLDVIEKKLEELRGHLTK